jgi:hypothetical protein
MGLPIITNIGAAGTTFKGTVNPESLATTYYVEYGATTDYGTSTRALKLLVGTDPVGIACVAPWIEPGATVHYRIVATNSGGTTHGADRTFTAPPALYWKNVSCDNAWENVLNWFTDAAATVQATSVPWLQDDDYKGYNLALSNDAVADGSRPALGGYNLGPTDTSWEITGTFSGDGFNNNYGSIYGGTFSGDGFNNNGSINGGIWANYRVRGTASFASCVVGGLLVFDPLGTPNSYGNPGFPTTSDVPIIGRVTLTDIPKPSDILGAGLL